MSENRSGLQHNVASEVIAESIPATLSGIQFSILLFYPEDSLRYVLYLKQMHGVPLMAEIIPET